MFSWNFAKSAEAMFSRWAIKKVFKFLLKKKLGQFILGDIDLNQLDVQLRAGTIQLSDLALNVDYINQKFGAVAALTVKEGSIGSLSVTMPWKSNGCQIELDELELVLGPRGKKISEDEPAKSQYGEYDIGDDFRTSESDPLDNTVTTASVDVHEGVKTIAKMVKWLLTSFHVRINKLIVAFDPYTEDAKNNGFCRTLVMRIAEMECGTGTSEENNSDDHVKSDNFLGLNRLTNFVKFHGAILEFLQIDDDCDKQSAVPCASATTSSELVKVCCPPNVTTSIITGESGGFSGSVKLSIPWKNGSLDIRKVDADVNIYPLELRFQPSSIKCLLHLFEVYRDLGESGKGQMVFMDIESVYHNAASSLSSPVGSYTYSTERSLSNCGTSSEIFSPVGKETVSDTLLPGSHLISDWVSSTSRKQRESTSVEPDFGASVEQFFECFDELRTSQSALGNSGMWNWTCSVFSAITAASNLASGSLHTPTEHKHIETNLKANISGISLLFSFVDEDPKTNGRPSVHYLGAKFQSTLFMLQVCPSEMNIKATVEQFELADHFSSDNDVVDGNLQGYYDDIESQVTLIRKMQSAVEVSLPLSSPGKYHSFAQATKSVYPINRQIKASHDGSLYRSDVVKVTLFRTSGFIECLCTVNFGSSIHNVSRATSFSLKLPPFVLWVNFHLMTMILDILKEPRDLVETTITCHRSLDEACDTEFMSSSLAKAGKISCPQVKSSSSNGRLKGNVLLANARIILCFPYEKSGDFRNYTSWDQFIALDISTCSTLREEKVQASRRTPVVRSKKGHSLASCSLHLNVGNLGIYLLTASSTASGESESSMQNLKYLSQKIVSVTGQTGRPSVLSMFWQDDHLTGPWMAEKAKLLATSVDSSRMEKCVGKGHDFTSVTTVKDIEDTDTRTREEIIWSSSFILNAHVASVTVNFDSSQYKTLNDLIHQVTDWVSCLTSNPVDGTVQSFSPQTSVLMECDFVEFRVNLELEENIKGSIQNELPGCWHSFKLQTRKVELLSVLNIGGINDSIFSWMAHGMGSLWGSVTLFPTKEFLLISCHNSTMGRGDGDGSNVLSSRMSGSDIVHFWDPVNSYSHTSLTIRCATLFALGGRLDWLDSVSSFFSLSSSETEQAGYDHLQEEDCWRNGPVGSSFVVNLIDFGLSYEPYLGDFVGAANANEEYFGCLLAASSFKISNTMLSDSINREYKITVQELGLLLCPVSGLENIGNSYSVEHLRKYGYVKVAQEAHVEAILRMNSVNGHLWELECAESHIVLNTCHDTTSGLIRLSAQLQQIFAPDIEESIVHLQNQWDSTQQVHVDDEVGIYSGDHSFSVSQVTASHEDKRSGPGVAPHLMDEICENAFQLNQYGNLDSEFTEIKPCTSINAGHLGETHTLGSKGPPELIEEYFLSDVYSFSEPSSKKQPSIEALKCKPNNFKDQELQRGRSGWYGDASLRILENHVSEISKQTGLQKPEELECFNHVKHDKYKKVKGKVILKNINFTWRLCAGSDWQNFHKIEHLCVNFPGRDSTAYMELSLSGIEVNYLVFPDGDICMSRLSLSVLDLRVNDNSKDAPWKLVLGYYHSKDHPRVSTSKALKLDLEAVRPHPSTPLEEYRLCVGLLPVVLHLHQQQLDFLIKFFGEKDSLTSCAQQPRILPKQGLRAGDHNINEEALLPYFQKFDILPFTIRVDYSPCHVDLAALRGGKYVELVNLVPWKGVELQLRHVEGVGVYGWSCIIETIIGEWLEDISQNQVHKLLKGLPPIRSLVAVGSGAAKLVSLPVKNFKKDHRLLKGMQRGTIAFLRSISVEAIGLGVHLAAGAHEILLQAENILTTIPPSVPWPSESRINNNVRSNQPKDARQGIKQAYESISDGLGKSAAALVQSPLKRYQRGGGVGSVLATAVQSAPAAAIAPASATARAVHCALLGVRNSLDLERKKESMDKYLGSAQPL